MCGIAGLLGGNFPSHLPAAQAMGRALDHRGPDDTGLWQTAASEELPITLVHRRLAVQDLSSAGHQPMASSCGRYVLVFNGEIYNQHELRRDLQRQGHRFRSTSDTEVLLELLCRYGLAALQRLRGMYAFCLWDQRERRALLARDPYGIKPIYLWQGSNGQLLFASEVRCLLASRLVPCQLDESALAGFLASGSVPEPRTLVRGIVSLPPGWLGHWQAGRWHPQPHWHPCYSPGLPVKAHEQVRQTRNALESSLQAHLVSDVPVGLFLSGGLDSASILALSGADLTTLSIGFREVGFDESGLADALARHFGSRHVSMQLGAAQAAELLPGFLAAVDQPSIDGFNTYCVCWLAQRQGLKVVLSGLGGDELFGGYPSFRKIPQLLWIHRANSLVGPTVVRWLERSGQQHRQRLAAFLRGPATPAAAHQCLRGLFAPREVAALLQHWGMPATEPDDFDGSPGVFGSGAQPSSEPFPKIADSIAWLESSRYMGQQLLRDSDTYSMAHGLELRLPLVDAHLFRELAGLPSGIRLAEGKRLLRRAMPELHGVLPQQPKRGFALPFRLWFDQDGSPIKPGTMNHPLPPVPATLDLKPWPRRWGLMVLRHWLVEHLQLDLG